MGWSKKAKKQKPLSYAEQQFVKKLIEDAKAKRKTLRGYVVLKRAGSKQDLKVSGIFKDRAELEQCANEWKEKLSAASKKSWKIEEVVELNRLEYEDDGN